jgi:hypothetical protein
MGHQDMDDWCDQGWDPVAGSYEHSNEPSGSTWVGEVSSTEQPLVFQEVIH